MLLPLVALTFAVALIVTGVALVSIPAALVTAGVLLGCAAALFLDIPDKPKGGSA